MGQIKQRIKLNDFLAVKSRIYEIIDEIDQLNQEATKLAETLATNDYRGRSWTHYAASAGDSDRAKKIFNQAEALESPTNEDHELKEDLLDKLCYIWLAYARDRVRKK